MLFKIINVSDKHTFSLSCLIFYKRTISPHLFISGYSRLYFNMGISSEMGVPFSSKMPLNTDTPKLTKIYLSHLCPLIIYYCDINVIFCIWMTD